MDHISYVNAHIDESVRYLRDCHRSRDRGTRLIPVRPNGPERPTVFLMPPSRGIVDLWAGNALKRILRKREYWVNVIIMRYN